MIDLCVYRLENEWENLHLNCIVYFLNVFWGRNFFVRISPRYPLSQPQLMHKPTWKLVLTISQSQWETEQVRPEKKKYSHHKHRESEWDAMKWNAEKNRKAKNAELKLNTHTHITSHSFGCLFCFCFRVGPFFPFWFCFFFSDTQND